MSTILSKLSVAVVATVSFSFAQASIVVDFETDDSGSALNPGDVITGTTINGATFSLFNQGDAGNSRRGATPGAGLPEFGEDLPGLFPSGLNTGTRELILFNAECSGSSCSGQDPDLAAPGQGNILIISEDNDFDDPDDSRFGGTVVIDFDQAVTSLTSLVIDVDENDPGNNFAAGYFQGQFVGGFGFTTEGQVNNNLQAADFDGPIDLLIINLESSGGIVSLEYTAVPIPAAAWLMMSGLLGLATIKRKLVKG